MAARIYLDQDSANRGLVAELRRAGIDVLTSAEIGRELSSDESQLTFAAIEQRVVYTANVRDFARLHYRWLSQGRHHAGIIVRSQQRMQTGRQLRLLIQLLNSGLDGHLEDRLVYLENVPDIRA